VASGRGRLPPRVIDTSVISHFLKEPPDTRAALHEPHVLAAVAGLVVISAAPTVGSP
jgi:hypothetical protein